MTKSVFGKWIDLPWYFGLVRLLNQKGIYPFDAEDAAPVNADEFLEVLHHPDELALERQRALALFTAGTEWETDEIRDAIVNRVKQVPDVFMEVAGVYLKESELTDLLYQSLLSIERDSAEEYAFALIPFLDNNKGNIYNLVIRFMEKFTWYSIPIDGNEQLYYWLSESNVGIGINVELLRLISKAINGDINPNSSTISTLLKYGFRRLDVCKIAYGVRTKVSRFSRGYRKTSSIEEELRYELASCSRAWNHEEKELVKKFNGKLGKRICSAQNYSWFYKMFGYNGFENELEINFEDKLAVGKRRNILSETEFNLAVDLAGLSEENIQKLKLTFNEWDERLIDLRDKVKPESYSELYDCDNVTMSMLVEKYGLVSKEVNRIVDSINTSSVSYEDVEVIEQNLRERLHPKYPTVINRILLKHRDFQFDDDAKDFLANANKFGMQIVAKYSKEQLQNIPDEMQDYPYLIDAFIQGLDLTGISEDYYYSVDTILERCGVTEKVIKEIHKYLGIYETYDIIDLLESDGKKSKSVDEKTSQITNFMNSSYLREGLLNWANLTVKQVVLNWDRVSGLYGNLCSMISYAGRSERYKHIAGPIIHDYICEESAINAMNNARSIQSLTKSCEWCEEWLTLVKKKPIDFGSLNGLAVNHGYVNGIECWLTDIGIIAKSAIDGLDIPCWVVSEDDTGEKRKVFLGIAFEESYVWWSDTKIYQDAELELVLRRVN